MAKAFHNMGTVSVLMTLKQAGASFTGLLDTYPSAAGAYSMRRLSSSYTGALIRIRRSSDNTEQDIGYDGSGDLDTAAITSFVGSNSAYVVKWYDQSGNAIDLVQTTSGSQPRIVNAGTIDTDGGKPCIVFDGSDDYLTAGDNLDPAGDFHTFFIAKNTDTGSAAFYAKSIATTANDRWGIYVDSGTTTFLFSATSQQTVNQAADTTKCLYEQEYKYNAGTNNTHQAYKNNSLISTNTFSTANISATSHYFFLGAYNNNPDSTIILPAYTMAGLYQEFVIYFSHQQSNRSGIVSDQNAYYAVF